MSAGGLTGAGGGSIAGSAPPPLSKQPDNAALISYAQAGPPKPEGSGGKADANAKAGHDSDGWAQTEEQSQKLQDFDAVQGRPGLGDERQGDGQEGRESQPVLLAGTAGVAVAGGMSSGTGAGTALRVATAGAGTAGAAAAGAAAVGGIIFMPTNSSHDEVMSIPGNEQYRITGKSSEVVRSVEVANADGSWTKLGQVSAGAAEGGGTTVDLAEVNDVLKDRGFEPIDPLPTLLPGTPIDGPKGATILSTPIQDGDGMSVVSTPNDGPRGADVISTPIPEEQGPQISEARNTKVDGKLEELGLPTEGDVTFDPGKKATTDTLTKNRGEKHGYLDNDKNEWNWDKKKSEWDVTLSETGKRKLGHLSSSGTHINVAADGKITH